MKEINSPPVPKDDAFPAPARVLALSSVAVTTTTSLQQEETLNQDDNAKLDSVEREPKGTPDHKDGQTNGEEEETRENS
jgi:hypothetical protein